MIKETVNCTFTVFLKKLIKIHDLMTRLERQLMWIGMGHKLIMIEYPEMIKAYYQDDLEGILSSLERVKMENDNQAHKIEAYFKLVDGGDDLILDDWNCYLSKLKQDWEKKNVLLYLKKNRAIELRNEANATRKSLYETGLISGKLLEDLEKSIEGEQYDSIVPGVLIDPSFSLLEHFYYQHFDRANDLFDLILEQCIPEEPAAGIEKKKMAELLELLKEYIGLVCGSIVSEEVIKMTKSLDIGDIDGLKSGLDKVKIEYEKLVKEIEKYFELMFDIRCTEALDCWIELEEVHESLSAARESLTESGSSGSTVSSSGVEFYNYNKIKTGKEL